MTSVEVIDFIADLRGGRPSICDFCNTPTPEAELVPEEAGDWACLTCWNRWEAEDRTQRAELEREEVGM